MTQHFLRHKDHLNSAESFLNLGQNKELDFVYYENLGKDIMSDKDLQTTLFSMRWVGCLDQVLH